MAMGYLPMVIHRTDHQISGEEIETTRSWGNAGVMAHLAYELADAMLAEREKQN